MLSDCKEDSSDYCRDLQEAEIIYGKTKLNIMCCCGRIEYCWTIVSIKTQVKSKWPRRLTLNQIRRLEQLIGGDDSSLLIMSNSDNK